MRKLHLLIASASVAALLAVDPAAAQQQDPPNVEAGGGFKLTAHTHSAGVLLFPVDTLSFDFAQGEGFSYSSRPCGSQARFNDLGLDFRPDYPGVDDDDGTAPVRHRVAGTVTEVGDGRGTIEGTITTVLCVDQGTTQVESGNVIVTHFEARYQRVSENEVRIMGTFEISPTESTGIFQDLEGQGSIQGIFTCLAHQGDPSKPTCAQLGEFTDFVAVRGDPTREPGEIRPGLMGTYRDPTVQPV